jgi:hypothetical protein
LSKSRVLFIGAGFAGARVSGIEGKKNIGGRLLTDWSMGAWSKLAQVGSMAQKRIIPFGN